jgi:hypothetical protein
MGAAARAFTWVPKVDLYPLFTVCGAAVGFCSYAVYRNLANNPDVHINRAHRTDGAGEHPLTAARAQAYYGSVFRSLASFRRPATGEERPDVRIMRV